MSEPLEIASNFNPIPNSRLEQILQPVSSEIEILESQIISDISTDIPLLNNVNEHIIGSGGKRLRPALVLLGAEMFKGVNEKVIQAAKVIEYLHTATLLHDDVVDGAETRRARQAACRIWGNEVSILSGDYLFAMAFYQLAKMRNTEVLRVMSDTTTRMARGELLQLTRSFEASDEEEYFEIIINKTACLFAAAIKTGALLAGGTLDSADRLYEYGMALGTAFQIVDDALDYSDEYKTGKPVGGDLQERKVTLPLSHLLEKANFSDKRRLQQILTYQEIEKPQIEEVVNMMKNYGSIQYTLDCSRKYTNKAKCSLEKIPETGLSETLFKIADFIVSREI